MKLHATITASLLFLSCSTFAQPLQTVYHRNGKKALEGKWSYVPGSYFPSSLIGQMADPEWNGYNTISSVRRGTGQRLELFTSLRPEGPVTMWNEAGVKVREWHFKNGSPNGPYRRYFRDGKPEQEGTLSNGSPTGAWKRYNEEGTLIYTGTYKPFTQEELAARWTAAYSGIISKQGGSYRNNGEPEPINPFNRRSSDRDSFEALNRITPLFEQAERFSYNDASREGGFTYTDKAFTVAGAFKHDLRAGEWVCEEKASGRKTAIGFDAAGKLATITDTSGEKRSVGETIAVYKSRRQAVQQAAVAARQARQASGELDDKAPVFRFVEQMPEFDGDVGAYLNAHLKYPPEAKAAGASGRVIVQFVIREDGDISNVEVIRSSDSKELDEEAMRVIRAMPPWKPGKQQGKAVNVLYTIPVTFRAD